MKFSEFPKEINGFAKEPNTSTQNVDRNYVSYERGNDLGYVTAEDLAAGKLQVRSSFRSYLAVIPMHFSRLPVANHRRGQINKQEGRSNDSHRLRKTQRCRRSR